MDFRFSEDFLEVLNLSRDEALRTGWRNISPDHITLGILRRSGGKACRILESLGISLSDFKERLDAAVFVSEQVPWEEREQINLHGSALSLLQHASLEAARCASPELKPLHYLLALCRMGGSCSHDYLKEHGIELRTLVEASGLEWESYGLGSPAKREKETAAQDCEALAAAIEKRIREGYTTDNPHVS